MREIKFKVWCEFEVNGKIETSMETPASWFLLTQAGTLLESGPLQAPQPLSKAYKKAIPLFYIGLKDKNGKEIYEGDIIKRTMHYGNDFGESEGDAEIEISEVKWCINEKSQFTGFSFFPSDNIFDLEVIGNIYQNPEKLKEAK